MWTWKAGMKAVCVHDEPDCLGRSVPLRKGAVYTVVGVEVCNEPAATFDRIEMGTSVALFLDEATNLGNPAWGFNARRFRKIVSRTEEQDVSMFKRIASSPPAKGREVEREYSEGV